MKTENVRMLTTLVLLVVVGSQGIHSSGAEAATLPSFDRVRVLHAPRDVADFELTDQDGKPHRLSQFRGQPTLVLFGFTHCPDVCPMAPQKLRQLEEYGGEELADINYVMISVDDERDTPEVLKKYLSQFSTQFVGLTGEPDRVSAIAAQFSAAFFKDSEGADGHYNVSHSPQVFVVDQSGQLRAEFYNATTEAMTGVARALLNEGKITDESGGE